MPRLERKFGLFRCPCDKKSTWASAHVYCVYGTLRVYFKQKCKSCLTPCYPFQIRNLRCPDCGQDRDFCECECIYCNRHRNECICEFDDDTDVDEPHRSDLCLKCASGNPCTGRRRRRSRRRRRNRKRNGRAGEIVIYQRVGEN